MLILTTGMIRSGSTWSFNVCLNLLRTAERRDVKSAFVEEIRDWQGFVEHARPHAVLKCHSLDIFSLDLLKRNPANIKFVYTFRDPFDVVASAFTTFDISPDDALSAVEVSLQFFAAQREMGPVCLVPYSLIESQKSSVIVATIARFLQLDLAASAIKAVDECCCRENQRALLNNFAGIPSSEIYSDERYTYHRSTLLHHNHFREPDALGWESVMNDEQIRRATAIREANKKIFEAKAAMIVR